MLRKLLATTAVLLITSIGVASAQQGSLLPPASITVNDATPVANQDITVTSTGWQANSGQENAVLSDPINVGRSTADANGRAVFTFKMPNVPAGDHHVQVSGIGADGKPLVQRVKVVVASASGGNNLPKTGADSTTPIAQIGAGAVAAGGLLLLVARKRRTSVKSAA
jgi:LPXTG-motif cell wall-anchored protein